MIKNQILKDYNLKKISNKKSYVVKMRNVYCYCT